MWFVAIEVVLAKQKHKKDEKVAKEMANYLGYNFTLADIVGEGGGIE